MNRDTLEMYLLSQEKGDSRRRLYSHLKSNENFHGKKNNQLDNCPRKQWKRKHDVMFEGEIRKLKPTTFDGEKLGDIAKLWLMDIDKYLQLHNYLENQ